MAASDRYSFVAGSYADAGQPGLYSCVFDRAAATLAVHGSWNGIANPTFLVVHPTQPWVYAVSETSMDTDGTAGAVWALQIAQGKFDAPTSFRPLNHRPSGGDHPCHLSIDPSQRWLVVSNYSSGSVSVFPVLADGSLGEMADHVQHQGGSGVVPDRQAGPHAHSTCWTPDGAFLIVADLGLDQLRIYTLDAGTGKLTFRHAVATRPGAGPRHMQFHPREAVLYVANELSSTVAVYRYAAGSGQLDEQQVVPTLPGGAGENLVADIHITPTCDTLYVSNRGHNSLAVYAVDSSGCLSLQGTPSCGGNWPRNFAATPDGAALLVANQYSGDIVAFARVDGGLIGDPLARLPLPGASCIQWLHHDG
ncbi:MAG: lactonase family protein [Herpetosiphon sp.]